MSLSFHINIYQTSRSHSNVLLHTSNVKLFVMVVLHWTSSDKWLYFTAWRY